MSRTIWKPGTFEYPIPAALISSGTMEESNLCTVAWTGIINTDPAMCYISLRETRYSYELIKKYKEFVINLTNERLAYATDWCGVRSGRNFDKFKEMKLTKEPGKFVKCPLVGEAPVSIECKVVGMKKLGSHTMIMAKVLSIDADDKYIDKKGAFDISKCDLIAYANGGYYALGKKLGTFGYSVKKKSTAKKTASKNSSKVAVKKDTKKSVKKTVKTNNKKQTKNKKMKKK